MPELLRKKMIELDHNLAASDMQCIGITYKPVLLDRSKLPNFKDDSNVLNFNTITDPQIDTPIASIARSHIFLGALISGYVPKEVYLVGRARLKDRTCKS